MTPDKRMFYIIHSYGLGDAVMLLNAIDRIAVDQKNKICNY